MDRQFLEFWGNYLLAAAKGQKQLEDMNQWLNQGFSGYEELTAMFKKFYGLERHLVIGTASIDKKAIKLMTIPAGSCDNTEVCLF